jgi:hypothetical protein
MIESPKMKRIVAGWVAVVLLVGLSDAAGYAARSRPGRRSR